MKLYYPTHTFYYEQSEYGDMENDPTDLSPWESVNYLNEILGRISREQDDDEMERGLMAHYHKGGTVNDKVFSAKPSAEVIDGQLYGVAVCRIWEDLTTEELEQFKDYWSGQMSDGYGEGFEQREIRCGDGNEIYVSFWNPGNDWSMLTLEELRAPRRQEQPMDVDRFWSIIEQAGKSRALNGSIEKPLCGELQKLSPPEILQFDAIFREYHSIADNWLMWSAANLYAGSLSDDGFIDFRAGLISQGRDVYRQVVQSPDSLALLDQHVIACDESAQYAASTTYDRVREPDSPDYYRIRDVVGPPNAVAEEIQSSVDVHPLSNRRVESLEDAVELLPQCNARFAAQNHNYNTWIHPLEDTDVGFELTQE